MSGALTLVLAVLAKLPSIAAAGIETYEILSGARKTIDENKVVGDPVWERADASVRRHEEEWDAARR